MYTLISRIQDNVTWFVKVCRHDLLITGPVQVHHSDDVVSGIRVEQLPVQGVDLDLFQYSICRK